MGTKGVNRVIITAMHSELFSLFGLPIQAYGLLMAVGFMACYFMARRLARLTGRDVNEPDTLIMIAAVCGVIGARAVYVWQNWATEFAEHPLAMFQVWRGGLVFYGGFVLAAVGMVAYALMRGEPLRRLTDFCVVFVPLGHAFGRLGCFFHGCCFGGLCSVEGMGVRFPKGSPAWMHQLAQGKIAQRAAESLPVWPTQLIEAAGCAALFVALWWLYRTQRARAGLCSGVYCVGYALLRFLGECLRDDPRGATYWKMSFSQTISVGLLMVGLAFVASAFLLRSTDGTIDR